MKKTYKIAILFTGLFLFYLIVAETAIAQQPVLTVDPTDSPLIIRGTLNSRTSSFSGNIQININYFYAHEGKDEKQDPRGFVYSLFASAELRLAQTVHEK